MQSMVVELTGKGVVMPKGTKVEKCFQKLRRSKGDASAVRICQSSTKQSLRTGRKLNKKPKGY